MSIVLNLSFYIIIGFIGSALNFLITYAFFINFLTLSYFLIIVFIIFQRIHRGMRIFQPYFSFTKKHTKKFEDISLSTYIRSHISLNGILLSIFIILFCIYFLVNTEFFIGTDPWLHISIIKYITEINYLPINEYYGALGLHIFGTVIHFFSGLHIILIPKIFIFYTFPLASLIVYNLLRRIFKNQNLAIFGVFLLLISSLGFYYLLVQFWPSSLALIMGLTILLLLYVRLQPLIKESIPEKGDLLLNTKFSYTFMFVVFIASLLTHSLLTMVLIFSYLWVFLIYFVNNYRRGIDFIILFIFHCIFLIFYFFRISTGHFRNFDPFKILSWYHFLFGALLFIPLEILILFHYHNSLDFSKGKFKLIIIGKKNKIYKKIENKFIFPLVFGVVIIFTLIFSILNLTIFNINLLFILNFVEILIICSFAVWGLILFQYKPRGKTLFFWGIALIFILLIIFIFDVIIGLSTFFLRIFYFSSIIITIGFVSYLYKIIKTNSIQKQKFILFIIFTVVFSLFTSFLYDTSAIDTFCLRKREVSSIRWYANYASNKKVIISEFGWGPVFIYYNYPFEAKNRTLPLKSIYFFLTVNSSTLHPSLHNSDGINILKELKEEYNTDVIIILPGYYYSLLSWSFFDQLTEEEKEVYYSLEYLNRIYSVKTEFGEETPYYWVI